MFDHINFCFQSYSKGLLVTMAAKDKAFIVISSSSEEGSPAKSERNDR